MKILRLKPVDASAPLFARLEKRSLIRVFKPTKRSLGVKKGRCVVDTVYSTSPRYGAHKLICVGKNETKIDLTTHPDNEDFIIINPTRRRFKPLYLIVGLKKHDELSRLSEEGLLESGHFLAVKLKYDDPEVCAFTMLKGTPHCEVTVPGKACAPVFFVTEPERFCSKNIKLTGHKLWLDK